MGLPPLPRDGLVLSSYCSERLATVAGPGLLSGFGLPFRLAREPWSSIFSPLARICGRGVESSREMQSWLRHPTLLDRYRLVPRRYPRTALLAHFGRVIRRSDDLPLSARDPTGILPATISPGIYGCSA